MSPRAAGRSCASQRGLRQRHPLMTLQSRGTPLAVEPRAYPSGTVLAMVHNISAGRCSVSMLRNAFSAVLYCLASFLRRGAALGVSTCTLSEGMDPLRRPVAQQHVGAPPGLALDINAFVAGKCVPSRACAVLDGECFDRLIVTKTLSG
jgi:hypothetical protein